MNGLCAEYLFTLDFHNAIIEGLLWGLSSRFMEEISVFPPLL